MPEITESISHGDTEQINHEGMKIHEDREKNS